MPRPSLSALARTSLRQPGKTLRERDWIGLFTSLIVGLLVAGAVLGGAKLLTLATGR